MTSARPQPAALIVCALLIPFVGVIDVAVGSGLSLQVFYLLAVLGLTWSGGARAGTAGALAAAFAAMLSDVLIGDPYLALRVEGELPWAPYWNGVSRLFVYLIVVFSVSRLQRAVAELQAAFAEIRTLQGLLPVCAWCKQIRDEAAGGEWKSLERYVSEHTEVSITHGICPTCADKMGAEP